MTINATSNLLLQGSRVVLSNSNYIAAASLAAGVCFQIPLLTAIGVTLVGRNINQLLPPHPVMQHTAKISELYEYVIRFGINDDNFDTISFNYDSLRQAHDNFINNKELKTQLTQSEKLIFQQANQILCLLQSLLNHHQVQKPSPVELIDLENELKRLHRELQHQEFFNRDEKAAFFQRYCNLFQVLQKSYKTLVMNPTEFLGTIKLLDKIYHMGKIPLVLAGKHLPNFRLQPKPCEDLPETFNTIVSFGFLAGIAAFKVLEPILPASNWDRLALILTSLAAYNLWRANR